MHPAIPSSNISSLSPPPSNALGIWTFDHKFIRISPPPPPPPQGKACVSMPEPIFLYKAISVTVTFYTLTKCWNPDLVDRFFWAIHLQNETIYLEHLNI